MSREQDAIIAEWMGWQWVVYEREEGGELKKDSVLVPSLSVHNYLETIEKGESAYVSEFSIGHASDYLVPKFCTDLNAMALALAVVKERGFVEQDQYAMTLLVMVKESEGGRGVTHDIFRCATASAAQQAEALVKVIEWEAERC